VLRCPPRAKEFSFTPAGSLSGADIEAVLVRSRMRAALDKRTAVNDADIKGALEDLIPPSYPSEIDLQNIVAVLECTSKSLLPKKYHDADRDELTRKANELLALGRQGDKE
jgi:hypothetical protein